jgi:hypothetical protein
VGRHAESLGSQDGNCFTEAISEPPTPTPEKLAKTVWSSLKKTLVTGESVFQFIGCLVTAAGVAHEWRSEGLMILNPVVQAADGATGTSEAAGPAPQSAVSGDANPADARGAEPAPRPSVDVSAAIKEPAVETATTPPATGQAPAVADGSSGGAA